MNPFLLSLIDGTSFFVGLAAVAVGEILLVQAKNRLLRSGLTVLVIVGILLVLISATPLPLWLYGLWTVAAFAGLASAGSRRVRRTVRIGTLIAAVSASLVLCLVELPYRFLPPPINANGRTVYVLGDSLSAGAGGGRSIQLWPQLLADRSSLDVVNLAQAGATVATAIKQAGEIAPPGSVVIVEIGGNDLLGNTTPADFRRQLDKLLANLAVDGHEIVMFELPLLPLQNSYGRAQRQLAVRHGVKLIPKRCLANVFGTRDATTDGLHLSPRGHEALANQMSRIVRR